MMLFVIGSLFGLWIGATLTNKSFFTKNSLLPKIVEKWEVRKAKKTGILWIRRIKKTACRPHPKIMIVLNNYRQTTSCFSKPLKVSFFLYLNFFWIQFNIFLLFDRAYTDLSVFAYQKYDIAHIFTSVFDIYGKTKIQTAVRQTPTRLQSGFASEA